MAGDPFDDRYLTAKTVFTLREAIAYTKRLEHYPTGSPVRWRNIRTGGEVIIGYNSLM